MAYNEDLADRIREFLSGQPDVREQRMFGGLSFLVGGKLTMSASRSGGLLIRVDPAAVEELIERGADEAKMGPRNRQMSKGWLTVAYQDLADDADLAFWLSAALDYNKSA